MTFHVTNDATAPRTLVVEGAACSAFAILTTEPAGVVWTAAAIPCAPCGCPNPGAGTKRVAELAPGQSVELTWDARKVTALQDTAICGGSVLPYTRFVAAPVAAGSYRVRLALFSATPSECGANGTCDPLIETMQTGLPYAELCSADVQLEADFELPADGDVTVPISID